MQSRWGRVLGSMVIVCAVFALAAHASAATHWTAQLRPGFIAGEGDNPSDFYFDVFLPVWGNDKALVYFNPNLRWDDHDGNEQNFGIGYRRLILNNDMIIGANLFYDQMRSRNNYDYRQIGVGLEMMTKWIDARANYYHPISGRLHHLGSKDEFSFGSSALLLHKGWEEQEKGFDVEIGTLVPFISDYVETRAYLGGYMFNSKVRDDITGMKIRAEVRPAKILNINMEVKDDDVNGIDTFIGAYLDIPFSIENVFKGKNPFEGLKDALAFGKGTRSLKERMVEKVIRDRNIPVYELTGRNSSTDHYADMIYVNQDNSDEGDGSYENPYQSLDSVPGDELYAPGAWVHVFSWDNQPDTYYGTNIQWMLPDMVLWGEGYKLRNLGRGPAFNPILDGGFGEVVPVGMTAAVVDAVSGATGPGVVNIHDNNEVMGFTIQNGATGIYGNNIKTAYIHDNLIRYNYGGAYSDTGIHIENSFTNDEVNGQTLTYRISNNQIVDNSSGIYLQTNIWGNDSPYELTDITINNIFENNTVQANGSNGIYVYHYLGCNSTTNVSNLKVNNLFTGNTVSNNGDSGIFVYNNVHNHTVGYTLSNVAFTNTFTGNTVTSNSTGIYLSSWIGDGWSGSNVLNSQITNSFTNNTVSDNAIDGITGATNSITAGNTVTNAVITSTFSGNTVNSNGNIGINWMENAIYSTSSAAVTGSSVTTTLTGNAITNNSLEGFSYDDYGSYSNAAATNISLRNNRLTDNGSVAVYVDLSGAGTRTVDLGTSSSQGRNSFWSSIFSGIDVFVSGASVVSAEYNYWNNGNVNPTTNGEVNFTVTNWLSTAP